MFEMLRSKNGKLLVGGHRGAKGWAPENTMASFQKAMECKADIIEFDVHLSRDKRCVIIHDEYLDRTTDGTGQVRDLTWAELSKLDAGSWFDKKNRETLQEMKEGRGRYSEPGYIPLPVPSESYAGAKIPVLEEVLEWAKAVDIPVSIELKVPFPLNAGLNAYPDIVERVLELVGRYGNENRTQMHSFDHRLMLRCKQLNPNISTSISFYSGVLVDPLGPLRDAQANGVAFGSLWVCPELIELLHADERTIFAWGPGEDPFNEEEELAQLVKMGVDYVSSGFPDLIRQVVEKYV